MSDYLALKFLHLLLFAYWLGSDLGAFYCARWVRDRTLSTEARQVAVKVMDGLEQIPRYCLVLMLPVGYTLALEIGVVRLPDEFLRVLWFIALLWLGLVTLAHRWRGTVRGERVQKIELGWRFILGLGLLWDAWQAIRGRGHLLADWVSIKFLLFAAIIFCGLLIRRLGRGIGPALREVLGSGSTVEREAIIARGLSRTRPLVIAIWLLLLASAWVALVKPTLQ